MADFIWKKIARICAKPVVKNFLIRQAMKRPYLHIGDYMYRYWLVPFDWNLPFSIRIHNIMLPDADPYLHDHPWDWRTIILDGWYIEENVFGNLNQRVAGDTSGNSAETFHRIAVVPPGGVWTLFIMGCRRNGWGFMTGEPARKTYYRDYVSVNNRGELMEPQP